jgi:N6-adenosine-specific RNA methylase IME4
MLDYLNSLIRKPKSYGPYRVLLADPPWRFKNWSMAEMAKHGEKWARRNGRSPYVVMTTGDICKMPIGELGAKDSVMLLWGTYPKWDDARAVMAAWGYEYKTIAFTWVKQNPSGVGWHFGLGYHTRQNPEVVLLGTRGKGIKRCDNTVANLVIWPRGEHSAKPPIVRGRIERLYGDVPRLELFARERVPDWAAWGNEIEPDPGLEILQDYMIPPVEAIVDEDEYLGLPVQDTAQLSYDYGEQMVLI